MRASITALFLATTAMGCATTSGPAIPPSHLADVTTDVAEPLGAPTVVGTYDFVLHGQGDPVRGVLLINRSSDGRYRASISTALTGTLVPTHVQVDGDAVTMRGPDFSLLGALKCGEIAGNWSYRGLAGTLNARRR
jgi:hypothetical protein